MKTLAGLWQPLAILILSILAIHDHMGPIGPTPSPAPVVTDMTSVGRSYGAVLASTYADAWEKAAASVDAGKPMATIQADLQAVWLASRTAAFGEKVEPVLSAMLPAGTEPTPSNRAAVSASYRDFAEGLRGVK